MQIQITYIYHNCFTLKLPDKTFLFDYPADQYLDQDRRAAIISQIENTDLYLFSSHNHADHFNRDSLKLSSYCRSLTCILSWDIVKKNRQFKDNPSCHKAEADQNYSFNGFLVNTLKSNDEGVAFLIHLDSLHIYFGGDLANWNWEDLNKQEIRLLVDYYGEVLKEIKQQPIQIAFSNTDKRLANWAGAAQFMETIRPKLFVPMHTFGETGSLGKYLSENQVPEGTDFFQYHKTGDTIIFNC